VTGKIIFLHGGSSSGKSTIARRLQQRIDQPFFHYSIDHLRDSGVLPMARIAAGELDWKEMRPRFFDGFHRSVAALASAGNNLILEHILDTHGWREQLAELLARQDLFFIGVHASLAELVRREKARGDRQIGSAKVDYHSIHNGMRYDLELSGEADVDENVDRLIAAWRAERARSEFFAHAGS
jgi:chloramphenicol 3-O phosphotransferase